jgi:hypothetical protein
MSSDYSTAQDNYNYYLYCREQGHDNYLRDAQTALAFFIGKQWTAEEEAEMRETNRPTLTLNQFFRNIDSIVGEMIYATGDVRYTPTSIGANQDVSSALDSVYMNVMQTNRVEYLEPRIMLQGLLTGRAYYDVRVNFDDNMQGQIDITGKRPQNIVLNPTIESPDPATWPEFFETSIVNLDDIALAYGDAAADEIKNTPQSDWQSPYDLSDERLLSQRVNGSIVFSDFSGLNMGDPRLVKCRRLIHRQFRELKYKEFFIDTQTGDVSQIPDNWKRDQIQRVIQATGVSTIKRRTKVVRWRVSCDQFMLHDEESPYKDFTIVPYFPYFVDGYTMSLGNQLVDMQRMTNKIYSQVLHILNSAANSGWKVKTGSLLNMTPEELETRGAKTGLVAELREVADLERIQPGQLPSGHDSLAQTISSMFKDISGYTTTMQGADRADASAKSLDSKLARGQVNLASAYKSLYFTKTMIADRVVSLAQDFYTETRLLHITTGFGSDTKHLPINQPTPEGSVLNDITQGKYASTVVPAPSRETVMQSAFQQLFDMRKELEVKIPDDVLIQYSAIPDKAKVLAAMQAATDPGEAQQKSQADAALQQAEIDAKNAGATNSQAQAKLALARAAKAESDANSDPNAERIALDRERLASEQARDAAKQNQAAHEHAADTAVKLTGLKLQHRREVAKIGAQHEQGQGALALQAADTHLTHAHNAAKLGLDAHQGAVDSATQIASMAAQHQRETAKNTQQNAIATQDLAIKKIAAKKKPTTPTGAKKK